MRIFLGIKVPEQTASVIQKEITKLHKEYPTALWVPTSNYHVTVTFIGEVENYKKFIPRIEESIYDISPFVLDLFTGGIFQRDSLTLYVECYRQKQLEKLAERLNQVLLGRALEHRYIPHITIARARNPSKQQYTHLKKKMEALSFDHSFKVDELILFKSELQRGGIPKYEVIETFTLQE